MDADACRRPHRRHARPQLITDRSEPISSVLEHLRDAGAPPALINTSFNRRGEPIVDTAEQALISARTIGLDFVILDDRLIALNSERNDGTT
ncbi:carbamoyltransferase C-terminal domain-containing protein [Streptomyces sp. NPDC056632]|uniref:carbamoyltransferase C-terminal domain-containing protein n=1 Tax=Streptomyces sp. NPDC056632 TaxID=3345884 RepID=UPI003684A8C8